MLPEDNLKAANPITGEQQLPVAGAVSQSTLSTATPSTVSTISPYTSRFTISDSPTPLEGSYAPTIEDAGSAPMPTDRFSFSLKGPLAFTVIMMIGGLMAFGAYGYFHKQDVTKLASQTSAAFPNNLDLSPAVTSLQFNRDTIITQGKKLTATGPVVIQNENDTDSAFKIQNSKGENLLVADTAGKKVGIGTVPTGSAALQVAGDISVRGSIVATGTGATGSGSYSLGPDGLRIGSVLVCSANGCISSSSPAPTPANPTIDVANVAYLNANQTITGNNNFTGISSFTNATGTFSGNGSGLSSLNAANLSSGTLSDSRLSGNVAKLDTAQTFTATTTHQGNSTNLFQIQNSAGNSNLLIADTINSRIAVNQATANYTLDVNGSINGSSVYQNSNQVCDTSGNCSISSTNLSDSSNIARLDANQTFTGSNLFKNSSNSTTAFQIQNANGTSHLFVADTLNARIAIGQTTAAYQLDVGGDINTTTGVRVGGNLVCSATGCNPAAGSGNYIQNGTSLQTANFTIQSSSNTSVVASIRGASGQSADVLDLISGDGGTNLLSVGGTGNTTFRNSINSTTAFQVQNAAGTSNLLVADTMNTKIGIGIAPASAGALLQVGSSNGSALAVNYSGSTTTNCPTSGTGLGCIFLGTGGGLVSGDSSNFSMQFPGCLYYQNAAASTTYGKFCSSGLALGANTNATALLQLASDAGNAASGIKLGTTGDTNLYRLSANQLKTDGSLTVGVNGNGTINAGTVQSVGGAPSNLFLSASGNGSYVAQAINGVAQTQLSSNGFLVQPSANSVTAFQVQNAAGTSNLFVADTVNNRIGIGLNNPSYKLQVAGGDIFLDGGQALRFVDNNHYITAVSGVGMTLNDVNKIVLSSSTITAAGSLAVAPALGSASLTIQGFASAVDSATLTFKQGASNVGQIQFVGTNQGTPATNFDYFNTLNLRAGYGGTTIASLTNTGQALFKNASDSTTAFQVQNSAGLALLIGDTTNFQVNTTKLQASSTIASVSGTANAQLSWNYLASTGLTMSGNEMTDSSRLTNTQGDGKTPPDSSTGIWESTTNLLANGGFESSTTGWSPAGAGATLTKDISTSKFGTASGLLTYGGGSNFIGYYQDTGSLTSGLTLTASVWVKGTGSLTMRLSGIVPGPPTVSITLTNAWTRYTLTGTSSSTGSARLELTSGFGTTAYTANIDGVQIEQKPIATPYVETNGSTASRAAAGVQAPAATVTEAQGWAAFRVRMGYAGSNLPTSAPPALLSWRNGTAPQNMIEVQADNNRFNLASIRNGTSTSFVNNLTYAQNDLVTVVAYWTNTTLGLSINGGAFVTTARLGTAGGSALPATFDIGSRGAGGSLWFDGDILWTATGTGTITNANAVTLNNYGNIDPLLSSLTTLNSGAASPTMVWNGNTSAIQGTSGTAQSSLTLDDASLYRSSAGTLGTNSNFLLQSAANSTTAFQIQNATGTSNLLIADTVSTRIGIGAVPANSLLTIGANTTNATGGITFGTDTNLYRLSAGVLKTDTAFTVGGVIAVGSGANATNGRAAIGVNATATGTADIAIGDGATANGLNFGGVAVGKNASSGRNAAAFGSSAIASAQDSLSLGQGQAIGVGSTAIGNSGFVQASGLGATAIGYTCLAAGASYSLALGGGHTTCSAGSDFMTNSTQGSLTYSYNATKAALYARGGESFTGVGTVSTVSGSATITGASTTFTKQLIVGDRITVNAETYTVTAIANDTSLTVSSNFIATNSGVAYTILPAIFKLQSATGSAVLFESDQGAATFKNSTDSTTAFQVQNAAGTTTLLKADTSNTVITLDANTTLAANRSLTLTGGTTFPGSPSEGQLFFRSDNKQLYVYANGKWQADRSTATLIVAASNSQNKEKADYVGDGTNDQNAFNSAITALPAGGGSIVLLEGTYNIASTINLNKSNVTLTGAGNNTILKRMYDESAANTGGIITIAITVSGSTVNQIKFDGNKASFSNSNDYGIFVPNSCSVATDIKIINNQIINTAGHGIYFNGNACNGNQRQMINDNTITGSSGDGINYTYLYNSQINNNIIYSNSGRGILASSGASNTISGNKTYLNGSNGIDSSDQQASISSNSSYSNTGFGINVNGNNVSVSGNTVYSNTQSGIMASGGNSSVSITGNTVYNNSQRGIRLEYSCLCAVPLNSIVSGNTVRGNGTDGIGVLSGGFNGGLISNNTISDNGSSGSSSGIYLSTPADIRIIGNVITDTVGTGYAIKIDSGTSNTFLSNNTYSGTGASSISDAGKGTIYDNQLDSSGNIIMRSQAGISLNGTATNYSLQNTGAFVQGSMSTPSAPTVTAQGTVGSTTWGYEVTAYDGLGETLASTETQIANGNATLNGTNFNRIVPARVNGAISYKVYRTTAGGTPATIGLIGTLAAGSTTFQFDDTGLASTTAVPTVNSTGSFQLQGYSALFKNSTDSTTAFQVQNSAGTSLFTVNTSNLVITLGSASSTPVILVLGTKNTSGDPATCTVGSVYYNSVSDQAKACLSGNKWGSLSGAFVTTLPASANDGDEVYYQADATNGIVWHLRYNSASASSYKWEYLGGSSQTAKVETQEACSTAAWTDLATDGPKVTVPRAGEYLVDHSARMIIPPATAGNSLYAGINASEPIISWMTPGGTQNMVAHGEDSKVLTLTAGAIVKQRYACMNGQTVWFLNRVVTVTPVRVQ